MSDFFQVFTQKLNHPALPFLAIALTMIIVLYINRVKIVHAWLNFSTRYKLDRLGIDQLKNVQCPDGLGSYFNIDRVILRADGISLLLEKRFPGKIFCADHIDDWTQMLGQKSYHFKNPLFELDYQIRAISECTQFVDIDGYLFFDHRAEFPRGHPDRVIHPKKIPETLEKVDQESVDTRVISAWNCIKKLTKDS